MEDKRNWVLKYEIGQFYYIDDDKVPSIKVTPLIYSDHVDHHKGKETYLKNIRITDVFMPLYNLLRNTQTVYTDFTHYTTDSPLLFFDKIDAGRAFTAPELDENIHDQAIAPFSEFMDHVKGLAFEKVTARDGGPSIEFAFQENGYEKRSYFILEIADGEYRGTASELPKYEAIINLSGKTTTIQNLSSGRLPDAMMKQMLSTENFKTLQKINTSSPKVTEEQQVKLLQHFNSCVNFELNKHAVYLRKMYAEYMGETEGTSMVPNVKWTDHNSDLLIQKGELSFNARYFNRQSAVIEAKLLSHINRDSSIKQARNVVTTFLEK